MSANVPGARVSEVEVRAVEEHPRVARAIGGQRQVRDGLLAERRLQDAEDVVVVPRHALAALTQLASPIVPAAQAVEDDDLVPERATGIDGRDARDTQVEVRQVSRDIGRHGWSGACGSRADFAPASIFTVDRT